MQAVILAAGKGTRFKPITNIIPKPMIPINGRPFIEYKINNLRNAGITDIIIVVGYLQEKIREYFGDSITYVEQKEQLGTAHAIGLVKDYIKGKFLVTMGDDVIQTRDFKELIKLENRVGVFKVEDPSHYGVVEVENNNIVDIEEKPENPKSNLINTAVYVFDKDIFDAISKIKKSARGEYEITDAIKYLIKNGKRFKMYKLKNWIDFGKPEDIEKLKKAIENF